MRSTALSLSAPDRSRLQAATRALLSPLAYAGPDRWRSAVSGAMKELLGADIATFVLPVDGLAPVYTEGFDRRLAAQYPSREVALPGGVSMWQRQARQKVWNRAMLYRGQTAAYYRSAYYNEYVVPLRAHDALAATVPLAERIGPDTLATVLFHHERRNGRRFGSRGMELLRLCFPAFEAGVRTWLRLREHTGRIAATLDATGAALLLLDPSGREAHRTPALCRALEADPDLDRSGEIARLGRSLRRGRRGLADAASGDPRPPSVDVRTSTARYRLCASYLGGEAEPEMILVAVERLTPEPVADGDLRTRFGLTRQQVRVARLLADGHSNDDIAARLFISPHTARHHTEHVLLKLDARSRAEVGRILREG